MENPSHHLISTPTERGTDEDEMQVDFSDLHSTLVDSMQEKKKKKCLPFYLLVSFLLFQDQRTFQRRFESIMSKIEFNVEATSIQSLIPNPH